MSQPENAGNGTVTSLEKIQHDWNDLNLRVAQLEMERTGLESENKQLRLLLERVIEHRQKSHGELITLLTTLVSKLPINDIGVIVSRLMEHNLHVIEVSASLTKGKLEDQILQPAILKRLDKTKRDLIATLKPTVDDLIKLNAPLEPEMLESLVVQPENFYLPAVARQLGLLEIESRLNEKTLITPEREHQQAWENIRNLIASRAAPAEIVAAIRKRMGGHYDADEVKSCWLALTDGDPMIFVRIFCLLPYLPNGQTDPLSRAIMETFVTRLVHEKYVAIYSKVLGALKNLHKVKADSPALVNFITLAKWVDTEAAKRIAKDIGMATP